MKYFIICEASPSSSNYNIAFRLACELKKRHEVYLGYFPPSSETMRSPGVDGELFWMEDVLGTEYDSIRGDRWQRIRYLISHPVYSLAKIMDRTTLGAYTRRVIFMKKAGKLCKDKGIDVVIGVTEPFISAKVASGLRVRSKKYIIQLDPYSYNQCSVKGNRELHKKRLTEEINVFKKTDKLFTTSLIKKDLIRIKAFGDRKEHIVEIEFPLIDGERTSKKTSDNTIIKKKEGEIAFLHCGSLYDDIRNPGNLVRLFRLLPENYKLYVAGRNSESIRRYDERIRERIVDLGCLSLEDAAQARVEADILISYNNLVDNQVPSKLFECINEGKPFINLCQLDDCPTLPYVNGYDMAYTVFISSMEKDVKGIMGFVEKNMDKEADRAVIIEKFRKNTIEYFAETIEDGVSK